ncbi:MAG TPA: endonuclease III domain-containing protein [Terriglobia bacterium]|nr:endonuclease III domain-containing protein [Terriglobia bacterium]
MRSVVGKTVLEPGAALRGFYDKMLSLLGPQDWWPARTRLEIIMGAILVQNTAWRNAALAIKRLRAQGLLSLARLRKASLEEIETCVRPAGFVRQKALTIRNFLAWLERECEGSLGIMFALAPRAARGALLEIKGFGPETVDAILLYAGGHPFFVADSYTRRILARHELVSPEAGYGDVQSFLHRHLPPDSGLFNEYHALLVEVGKQYCKWPSPQCLACPLEGFLGPNQPVQLSLPAGGGK